MSTNDEAAAVGGKSIWSPYSAKCYESCAVKIIKDIVRGEREGRSPSKLPDRTHGLFGKIFVLSTFRQFGERALISFFSKFAVDIVSFVDFIECFFQHFIFGARFGVGSYY